MESSCGHRQNSRGILTHCPTGTESRHRRSPILNQILDATTEIIIRLPEKTDSINVTPCVCDNPGKRRECFPVTATVFPVTATVFPVRQVGLSSIGGCHFERSPSTPSLRLRHATDNSHIHRLNASFRRRYERFVGSVIKKYAYFFDFPHRPVNYIYIRYTFSSRTSITLTHSVRRA